MGDFGVLAGQVDIGVAVEGPGEALGSETSCCAGVSVSFATAGLSLRGGYVAIS